MDESLVRDLPDILQQIRRSLQPYIKPRNEVRYIRKVLAKHLEPHMKRTAGGVARPLSLVESTAQMDLCPNDTKGLRMDYYRSLRANLKAREEYAGLSKKHVGNVEVQRLDTRPTDLKILENFSAMFDSFIELIKERRKRDRLVIIQDYFNILAQKPVAAADSLDPQVLFKDLYPIPQLPTEVLEYNSVTIQSEVSDLKDLANQLEKSVLRAKLLLEKEQKLLAKLKDEAQAIGELEPEHRLHALEMSRNELITWIEDELAKAGDEPFEADRDAASPYKYKTDNTAADLAYIRKQYARYIKAREALVLATAGQLKAQVPEKPNFTVNEEGDDRSDKLNPKTHVIYPLFEQLISISNEQKSTIQQKSHFTISLAKRLKQTNQGLDRLADESHLLPAYPLTITSTHRKALSGPGSFEYDISSHEKPDTTHRARAWVFASEAAGKATEGYVDEKLEEGRVFTSEASKALLELGRLRGADEGDANGTCAGVVLSGDIWAQLDGKLGMIRSNEFRT